MNTTISQLDPTEIASGHHPLSRRSQGLLPALPVVRPSTKAQGEDEGAIDVWAVASRFAHAKDRTAMQATCSEIRALSLAVLELVEALVSVRVTDRSEPYADNEARPDGQVPPQGERWRTPRLIVDQLIGWEEPKL